MKENMALDGYTSEQRKCIDQLRNRMDGLLNKDMNDDDSMFLRFLVARDYDLDAAELMLKNNLKWRKINKIDTLLLEYNAPEVASKYISFCNIGFTKEGLPVIFSRFGSIDFKGVLKALKKSEVLLNIAYSFEKAIELMKIKSEEMGKKIDKFTLVFDLSNFSLATATYKPALDIMIQLITMFDGNYPERLKIAYVLNASLYFTIFWAVVSPFLAGATFKKVKLYGKDGWKNDLLSEIDEDVLPAFIGGTLTDPDGDIMCRTFINHAGPVPEKYFPKRDNTFRKNSTTKKIAVQRLSKECIEMVVEKPGSILEWEFQIKSKDIGFSVLFNDTTETESELKEVVPKQRIETVISSEVGMFRCEKAGIYLLEFDNTYSWMYAKELYYTASVLKSDKVMTDL